MLVVLKKRRKLELYHHKKKVRNIDMTIFQNTLSLWIFFSLVLFMNHAVYNQQTTHSSQAFELNTIITSWKVLIVAQIKQTRIFCGRHCSLLNSTNLAFGNFQLVIFLSLKDPIIVKRMRIDLIKDL